MFLSSFTRRSALCLALAAGLAPGAAPAQTTQAARPEVGKYVKAYVSPDGVKVWTLRYGPADQHQALVQIVGADHPLDSRIVLTRVEDSERDTRYAIEHGGKPYTLLILADGRGELHLPGAQRPERLRYDEMLSQQGNAEHFLTDYQAQTPAR